MTSMGEMSAMVAQLNRVPARRKPRNRLRTKTRDQSSPPRPHRALDEEHLRRSVPGDFDIEAGGVSCEVVRCDLLHAVAEAGAVPLLALRVGRGGFLPPKRDARHGVWLRGVGRRSDAVFAEYEIRLHAAVVLDQRLDA